MGFDITLGRQGTLKWTRSVSIAPYYETRQRYRRTIVPHVVSLSVIVWALGVPFQVISDLSLNPIAWIADGLLLEEIAWDDFITP